MNRNNGQKDFTAINKYIIRTMTSTDGILNTKKVHLVRNLLIIFGAMLLITGIGLFIGAMVTMIKIGSSFGDMTDKMGTILGLAFSGMALLAIGGIGLNVGIALAKYGYGAKILTEDDKCSTCGTTIINGAEFCGKCGHQLNPSIVCPNCNTENNLDTLFCIKCGKEIITSATSVKDGLDKINS